jgi:hypothetical protein
MSSFTRCNFFIEFIDNEKKLDEVDGQMMMCIPWMSNYYLYDFLKNIGNEKN